MYELSAKNDRLSWDGVTGVTTFDENGKMNKDLLIIQIEDGEHVIVKG